MNDCLRRLCVFCLFAIVTPWVVSQAPVAPATPAVPATPEATANSTAAPGDPATAQPEKPRTRTVLPNGVMIEILRESDGPKPAPNSTVQLQYIGMLRDGTEFYNSYSDPRPPIIKLSQKIGCFRSGIPYLPVGSKGRLTCPPGSANGSRPVDTIPRDSTLFFDIELLGILN